MKQENTTGDTMVGLISEILLQRWTRRFAWLNMKRRIRKRQILMFYKTHKELW